MHIDIIKTGDNNDVNEGFSDELGNNMEMGAANLTNEPDKWISTSHTAPRV